LSFGYCGHEGAGYGRVCDNYETFRQFVQDGGMIVSDSLEEMTMRGWLLWAWHDPVWSKVITTMIIAVGASTGAAIKFQLVGRLKNYFSPKLTKVNARLSEQVGKTYPLKYYVEFRNDFRKCIEVSLSEYRPGMIDIQVFVPTTMQIFFITWVPEQEGVDRVALLPGQKCRLWIAIDPNRFTANQVKAAVGKMGELVVKVNKKDFPVQL
jgi:hypothetical protein